MRCQAKIKWVSETFYLEPLLKFRILYSFISARCFTLYAYSTSLSSNNRIRDAQPSSSGRFRHRSQLMHTMPCPGMTRPVTSYLLICLIGETNNKQSFQSAPKSRMVRPQVSPQPAPLGDCPILLRAVWRCQSIVDQVQMDLVQSMPHQSEYLSDPKKQLEIHLEFPSFDLGCQGYPTRTPPLAEKALLVSQQINQLI